MAGSVRASTGPDPALAEAAYAAEAKRAEPRVEEAASVPAKKKEKEEPREDSGGLSNPQDRSEVRFRVDKESRATVIEFRNSETGDVERQVPAEEALKAAKQMGALAGMFFEKEG